MSRFAFCLCGFGISRPKIWEKLYTAHMPKSRQSSSAYNIVRTIILLCVVRYIVSKNCHLADRHSAKYGIRYIIFSVEGSYNIRFSSLGGSHMYAHQRMLIFYDGRGERRTPFNYITVKRLKSSRYYIYIYIYWFFFFFMGVYCVFEKLPKKCDNNTAVVSQHSPIFYSPLATCFITISGVGNRWPAKGK